MKAKNLYACLILMFVGVLLACTHEPALVDEVPGPVDPGCITDGKVCFESSVLPIFISACARSGCHDAVTAEEGYILSSYSTIMRKGIQPGNASESKLYKILFKTGEDRMPPDGSLTSAQKDSIALWINQGALNTTNCNCYCDPSLYTYAAVISPLLSNKCTFCHKPGNLSGNIDLSTYNAARTQALNGNLFGSISHSDGYVAMPVGGKLSDCEIEQVREWVNAGALND